MSEALLSGTPEQPAESILYSQNDFIGFATAAGILRGPALARKTFQLIVNTASPEAAVRVISDKNRDLIDMGSLLLRMPIWQDEPPYEWGRGRRMATSFLVMLCNHTFPALEPPLQPLVELRCNEVYERPLMPEDLLDTVRIDDEDMSVVSSQSVRRGYARIKDQQNDPLSALTRFLESIPKACARDPLPSGGAPQKIGENFVYLGDIVSGGKRLKGKIGIPLHRFAHVMKFVGHCESTAIKGRLVANTNHTRTAINEYIHALEETIGGSWRGDISLEDVFLEEIPGSQ